MSADREQKVPSARLNSPWCWPALFWGIVASGLLARLWHLETLPPGFYFDEISMGYQALRIWAHNDYRVVYNDYGGSRLGLYLWIQAWIHPLLGPTRFAARLPAALGGAVSIAAIGWLMLELMPRHPARRLLALLAMALLAFSLWSLILSRVAFPATHTPFFVAASLASVLRAQRIGSLKAYFLAGWIGGMGMHTYSAYYPHMLIPAGLIAWQFFRGPRCKRQRALVYSAAFFLLTVPFAWELAYRPAQIGGRMMELFDPAIPVAYEAGLPALALLVVDKCGQFIRHLYVQGDINLRHGLTGRGQLDVLARIGLVLFALQCLYDAARRLKRIRGAWPMGLLTVWFCTGLWVPALDYVCERGACPNFLHGIGMLVPLYAAASVGLMRFFLALGQVVPAKWSMSALVLAVMIQIPLSLRDVFVTWASHPALASSFEADRYVNTERIRDMRKTHRVILLRLGTARYRITKDGYLIDAPWAYFPLFFREGILHWRDIQKAGFDYLTLSQFPMALEWCSKAPCALYFPADHEEWLNQEQNTPARMRWQALLAEASRRGMNVRRTPEYIEIHN